MKFKLVESRNNFKRSILVEENVEETSEIDPAYKDTLQKITKDITNNIAEAVVDTQLTYSKYEYPISFRIKLSITSDDLLTKKKDALSNKKESEVRNKINSILTKYNYVVVRPKTGLGYNYTVIPSTRPGARFSAYIASVYVYIAPLSGRNTEFKHPSRRPLIQEVYFSVYELDEEGDEVEELKIFKSKDKAISFARKQSVPTHVVLVPNFDPDDYGKEMVQEITRVYGYEPYEVVWESEVNE